MTDRGFLANTVQLLTKKQLVFLQRKTHDEHPTPYTPAYLLNWVFPYPSPLKVITHSAITDGEGFF